jgi:hypothetical protein
VNLEKTEVLKEMPLAKDQTSEHLRNAREIMKDSISLGK